MDVGIGSFRIKNHIVVSLACKAINKHTRRMDQEHAGSYTSHLVILEYIELYITRTNS